MAQIEMVSISSCNPSINLFAQPLCVLLERKNEMRNSNIQNHVGLRVGLILTLIGLIGAAVVVLSPARRASAQSEAASWTYTGSLNTYHSFHTATLLQNGKVLVAGGFNYNQFSSGPADNAAELYDPDTGIWSITGNLNTARSGH